MTTLRCK